jgi:hypothetical protein
MSLLTDILYTAADLLRLKIKVEGKYLAAKFEDGWYFASRCWRAALDSLCGVLTLCWHRPSIQDLQL